jgi:hypothetical protein
MATGRLRQRRGDQTMRSGVESPLLLWRSSAPDRSRFAQSSRSHPTRRSLGPSAETRSAARRINLSARSIRCRRPLTVTPACEPAARKSARASSTRATPESEFTVEFSPRSSAVKSAPLRDLLLWDRDARILGPPLINASLFATRGTRQTVERISFRWFKRSDSR